MCGDYVMGGLKNASDGSGIGVFSWRFIVSFVSVCFAISIRLLCYVANASVIDFENDFDRIVVFKLIVDVALKFTVIGVSAN